MNAVFRADQVCIQLIAAAARDAVQVVALVGSRAYPAVAAVGLRTKKRRGVQTKAVAAKK